MVSSAGTFALQTHLCYCPDVSILHNIKHTEFDWQSSLDNQFTVGKQGITLIFVFHQRVSVRVMVFNATFNNISVQFAMSWIRTGSCKSNYHTITTTTTPCSIRELMYSCTFTAITVMFVSYPLYLISISSVC